MNKYALVVAGGKGTRMGGEMPKQFLLLGGRPMLMHTLERFYHYDPAITLVLVLPPSHIELWKGLCRSHHFELPCNLVAGGEERFFSVKRGLACVPDDGDALVAVHDGVRPFVSPEVIERCYAAARDFGAAVPVIEECDSLRHITSEGASEAVDRSLYRRVQTPQTFRASLLKKGYEQPFSPLFTDDASVVEAAGGSITLVKGNRENIKITTPFDWEIAKMLLSC